MITQFRTAVYRSFTRRADAGLDLIDALTGELHTAAPVAVSAAPLFRRKFSSVYDVLAEPFIAEAQLRQVLADCQPDDAERIAGYEVYGLDCTPDPVPEAETVPDRSQSKKGKYAPTTVEHRYSWLARLVQEHTSWCMPQDVRRVATSTTDSQVGAAQVQDLAERNLRPKVVVADSLYCNRIFLAILLVLQAVYALVRMRSSMVLREAPPARTPGQKGRPRKHGAKFKLSDPARAPDQMAEATLLGQRVLLKAWAGLHLESLPLLTGMVLAVQFLKADGAPRFKRPLYLFWTGPTTVALVALVRMYLWRFAIEHMFRFLKQDLGLTTANSPALVYRQQWVWCCAIAYCQLIHLDRSTSLQSRYQLLWCSLLGVMRASSMIMSASRCGWLVPYRGPEPPVQANQVQAFMPQGGFRTPHVTGDKPVRPEIAGTWLELVTAPPSPVWTDRAREIRKLLEQGETLASIGQRFGLSAERVRQILLEEGQRILDSVGTQRAPDSLPDTGRYPKTSAQQR